LAIWQRLKSPNGCDGTNFEGVLVTIQEFNDATLALVYETGPELFYNFRLCLLGTARDDWEIVVEDADETVEAFEECIATFKRTFMTSETKQTMVDYIQSIKKPHSIMDVLGLVRRIRTLNRYVEALPDAVDNAGAAVPALTEAQIKNVVFLAMPDKWQTQFHLANLHVTSSTLHNLIEYFELLSEVADRGTNPPKNDNGNRQPQGPQGRGPNNGGCWAGNKRRPGGGRNNNNHANKRTKLTNDMVCPLPGHGGHTWGQCFENQHGSNFRPKGAAGRGNGNNGGRGGRGGRNGRGYGPSSTINTGTSDRTTGYGGPTHQTFYHDAPLHRNNNNIPGGAGGTQTPGPPVSWDARSPPGALLTTSMLHEPNQLRLVVGADFEVRMPSTARGTNPPKIEIFNINLPSVVHCLPKDMATTPTMSNIVAHVFDLDSYMFHVPLATISDDLSLVCHHCFYTSIASDDDIRDSQFDVPEHPSSTSTSDDLVPSTLLVAKHADVIFSKPLKVLFDTGSNISLINCSCLPADIEFNILVSPLLRIVSTVNAQLKLCLHSTAKWGRA
jgi:hypothetical protein